MRGRTPRDIAALTGHSGAPRGGEPGIHEYWPLEYGFRVLAFGVPRNDGVARSCALPAGEPGFAMRRLAGVA